VTKAGPPPTSRKLRLATGLDYHLLEWGQPGAPVVVMCHGFLDLAWAWTQVAEALADRYRVIAIDWRGHGDSDWVGAGGYYYFMDYVADLDDVIAQVAPGDEPVNVVAHSMGGTVALYWAGVRPAKCRRVVSLEGIGPPQMPSVLPARTAGWIDGWKRARSKPPKVMASLADAAARMRKHDPLLAEDDAVWLAERGTRAVDGGLVWKHDPLHLTQGPYPFRRDAAFEYWQAITAPVLYVEGEQSSFRALGGEIDARLGVMKHAQRAVIDGAGHAIARHRPAALVAVLQSFLADP
jgi:pimeloyl-ACP methyl ester carboxylesterase